MSETIFGNWESFKNGEKCFLFCLKGSFCDQLIYYFVLTFWTCRKTAWLERYLVDFKIYYVTTGKQTIAIHILPNILRSKDNQAMEFGQFLEYIMKKSFLEKSYTKCGGGKTIPKIKIEHILVQQSKVLNSFSSVCLLLYAKLSAIGIYWN